MGRIPVSNKQLLMTTIFFLIHIKSWNKNFVRTQHNAFFKNQDRPSGKLIGQSEGERRRKCRK